MSIFLLIIVALPVLDVLWWLWADRRLRRLPHPRWWRPLLAIFAGGNLLLYIWVMLSRLTETRSLMPSTMLGLCYIWHLVVLPLTIVALSGGGAVQGILTVFARLRALARLRAPTPLPLREGLGEGRDARLPETPEQSDQTPSSTLRVPTPLPLREGPGEGRDARLPETPKQSEQTPSTPSPALTRRQVLAAAAVALPPIATAAAQVKAMAQLSTFRIRRLDVQIPGLPPALDGLTIAHVSDLHVGRFTNGPILRDLVTRTNAMGCDLVVFTGDLIDHSLRDLPAGIDVLHQLAPADRLFVCEGNHDLFEGREAFESRVRQAGLRLLLDEAADLRIRGHRVQLLGLRWGRIGGGREPRINDQMDRLLAHRDSTAFPILLAHHPHAFDRAAEAGLPLTLSGHTHGGQLMLTRDIGAGPLIFKYWSGLYRQGDSALVVSNGVGNWLPLRINAPAEVLHLTLRPATGEP